MTEPHHYDKLSDYYDGQLGSEQHTEVARHVDECDVCRAELATYMELSAAVAQTHKPAPPAAVWDNIERALCSDTPAPAARSRSRVRLQRSRWMLMAASVLVVVGIGGTGFLLWQKVQARRHVVDLNAYLNLFEKDPHRAVKLLAAKYDGRPLVLTRTTTGDGAVVQVLKELPKNYAVKDVIALKMPGCNCVHCTCHTATGETVAVLEQDKNRRISYGKRPVIHTCCNGTNCQIVQVGNRLAVTWQQGQRSITVIGVRNLDEVQALIAKMNAKSRAS